MGAAAHTGSPLRPFARPGLPFGLLATLLGRPAGELIPAPLVVLWCVPRRLDARGPSGWTVGTSSPGLGRGLRTAWVRAAAGADGEAPAGGVTAFARARSGSGAASGAAGAVEAATSGRSRRYRSAASSRSHAGGSGCGSA